MQDQLGHSTIVLTADTYTSVLPETARTAAELTAALLFPARPRPRRARQAGGEAVPQAAPPGMGNAPPRPEPRGLTACHPRGTGNVIRCGAGLISLAAQGERHPHLSRPVLPQRI